jgi:hypothetical protein
LPNAGIAPRLNDKYVASILACSYVVNEGVMNKRAGTGLE